MRFRGEPHDSLAIPGAYSDMKLMLAARSGELVPKRTVRPKAFVCSAPVRYTGLDELRADLDNLKAALAEAGVDEGFVTSVSPSNLELYYENRHYGSDEEYLGALAKAMRVEAVNHALRGIPEERVRFHTCYSVNVAPRAFDFELKHFVDLMLRVRAGAYLIESARIASQRLWPRR